MTDPLAPFKSNAILLRSYVRIYGRRNKCTSPGRSRYNYSGVDHHPLVAGQPILDAADAQAIDAEYSKRSKCPQCTVQYERSKNSTIEPIFKYGVCTLCSAQPAVGGRLGGRAPRNAGVVGRVEPELRDLQFRPWLLTRPSAMICPYTCPCAHTRYCCPL